MENQDIKYSILVPARNGGKYLPTCIETVVRQHFTDYELIISDDHSADETDAFLRSINHPNVRIVHPPESLSMAEHWEWVLMQSRGEWVMFLGQDDGLQPYFFRLAEKLSSIADRKGIRTIMSARAFFFWPGCGEFYGDTAVDFSASAHVSVLNCKFQALLALLGFQNYFELPEMYTTSLFRRDLLNEARKKQKGRIFVTHPQDANLAAIACSLESKYVRSSIPLGWVGSSPRSAGLAIIASITNNRANFDNTVFYSVAQNYLQITSKSQLPYHPLAGDFSLGSCTIYFWSALLYTQGLRKSWLNKIILAKAFKLLLFASVLEEINSSRKNSKSRRLKMFKEILIVNSCNQYLVTVFSKAFKILRKFFVLLSKVIVFTKRRIYPSCLYKTHWQDSPNEDMLKASREIEELMKENRLIEIL
ncbi:MAG: glycosyltransferase family A protein [Candidatus Ozemobacteraceae bacterium]